MNRVLTALYKIAAGVPPTSPQPAPIDWTRVPKTKLRVGFTPVYTVPNDDNLNALMKFVGGWESARVGKDGRHYPYMDSTGKPTFLYGVTDPELIKKHAYTGLPEEEAQRIFADKLSSFRSEFNRAYGKYTAGLNNDVLVGLNAAYYNMGYPRFNKAFGSTIRSKKFSDIPAKMRAAVYSNKALSNVAPKALGRNPKIPAMGVLVVGADGKKYGFNHGTGKWFVKDVSDGLRRRREAEAALIERGLAPKRVTPKPEPRVIIPAKEPRVIIPAKEPDVFAPTNSIR